MIPKKVKAEPVEEMAECVDVYDECPTAGCMDIDENLEKYSE